MKENYLSIQNSNSIVISNFSTGDLKSVYAKFLHAISTMSTRWQDRLEYVYSFYIKSALDLLCVCTQVSHYISW